MPTSPSLGPIVGTSSFRYQTLVGWEQLPAGGVLSKSSASPPIPATVCSCSTAASTRCHGVRAGRNPPRGMGRHRVRARPTASPSGRTTRSTAPTTADTPFASSHRTANCCSRSVRPASRPDTGATSIDFRTITPPGRRSITRPTSPYLSGRRVVHHRRLRKRARPQVRSPTGDCSVRGANRAPVRASSACRTGSPWTVPASCTSRTARTAVFRSSRRSGEFISEWTDLARPMQVFIDRSGQRFFVAELGWRAGCGRGTTAPTPDATGGRMSMFDARRACSARWGGGADRPRRATSSPRTTSASIRTATMYVAEVAWSAGGNRGLVPPDCHSLQKFTRL